MGAGRGARQREAREGGARVAGRRRAEHSMMFLSGRASILPRYAETTSASFGASAHVGHVGHVIEPALSSGHAGACRARTHSRARVRRQRGGAPRPGAVEAMDHGLRARRGAHARSPHIERAAARGRPGPAG